MSATPPLDDLAVFAHVVRLASFTAAARELGVPKSTVSRTVARLEAAMGVRLLHRSSRSISTSTAGAALHARVSPLLSALGDALRTVPEQEEAPSGLLRLTAPPDYATTVLAPLLARFTERHPAIEVELKLGFELIDLVGGGFDAAIRFSVGRLRDSSLQARRLAPLAIQLYGAPAYLAAHGTPRTPDELEGHRWTAFNALGPFRLEGPGASQRVAPRGRLRCDDMTFVREAVRSGAGLAFMPTFLADDDVAAGRLVRVLPKWRVASGHIWFVTPGGRQLPRKVLALREALEEALGR